MQNWFNSIDIAKAKAYISELPHLEQENVPRIRQPVLCALVHPMMSLHTALARNQTKIIPGSKMCDLEELCLTKNTTTKNKGAAIHKRKNEKC